MAKNTQLNNGAKKFINTTQRIHLSTASLISYIGKFLKFCRIYLVKFRNTIDKIIISRKENWFDVKILTENASHLPTSKMETCSPEQNAGTLRHLQYNKNMQSRRIVFVWDVSFCRGRNIGEPGDKPLTEQGENQQKSQPTYMYSTGLWCFVEIISGGKRVVNSSVSISVFQVNFC